MGKRLQERRRKINKTISWKGGRVPEQRFFRLSAMLHKVWDKKRNLKIAESLKMIGKVETGAINRERRKATTSIHEVEVTTNITQKNPQQTNSIKMTKKNGLD